METVRYNSIY